MKAATLPPYVLAILMAYVHGICQLCQRAAVMEPKIGFEVGTGRLSGILNRAPLVCHHCHHQWVGRLPSFVVEVDDRRIPLHVSAYYDVPLKQVMSAFKDKGDILALMVLYHLLRFVHLPKHLTAANSVLVPTPTTPSRLSERGFYPVLVLTRYLSYLWQIPIWQGIHRTDNITHQRGLGRADRLHNVKNDFYLTDVPSACNLIFVDDVVTTGSTLSAMASAIWVDFPTVDIYAVGVLHGREDIHLPFNVD